MRSRGITHVLSLCDDAIPKFEGVSYSSEAGLADKPSSDIESRLPQCLAFIDEAISQGGCVLVHCFQGR